MKYFILDNQGDIIGKGFPSLDSAKVSRDKAGRKFREWFGVLISTKRYFDKSQRYKLNKEWRVIPK